MSEDSSRYVCSLTAKYIKKAKDELSEIPEDRMAAVQAFREWIEKQVHIRLPTSKSETDTSILLMFLRWAKFSQLRARERIVNYLKIKNVSPLMWRNIDTSEKGLEEVLKTGYLTFLPRRDQNGCQLIIYKFAAYKHIGKFTHEDFFRAGTVALMYALRDEMTQVNGTVLIIDFTGMKMSILTKAMESKARPMKQAWLGNMPTRWKQTHVYNGGMLVEAFLSIGKSFVTSKLLDRVVVHETLESLYKYVPKECLPIEYLPDDYKGHNAGHVADIQMQFIENMREDGFNKYLKYITSDEFSVDESKIPTDEVAANHFRKLTVS